MKVKNQSSGNSKIELQITQEISFAKVLAGNDKKLRDKAVKKLMKWLAVRSKGKTPFTEENFHRIWTGLFYCMWMSDKFLVQEELAESISRLIHCFHTNTESALLFIKCFYKIMGLEWAGIDQHRIDKFNMLIRRFLRQSFEYCKRKDWNDTLVKALVNVFEEGVLNLCVPSGYLLHFIDIFPEELSKVSKGKLKDEIISIFLEPFIKVTAHSNDARVQEAIYLFFNHLIRQTDVGIEYEEKFNAWKQMGMPSERPEDLELCIENESGEEGEKEEMDGEEAIELTPLDPRAGKVDTILPQIPIDFIGILSIIKKYQTLHTTTSSGRRRLKTLEKKFTKLKEGKMPENIFKPKILDKVKKRRHSSKCVRDLIEFTKKLDRDDDLDNSELLPCEGSDSDEDFETDEINAEGPVVNDVDDDDLLKNESNCSSVKSKKKPKCENMKISDIKNCDSPHTKSEKLKPDKKKKKKKKKPLQFIEKENVYNETESEKGINKKKGGENTKLKTKYKAKNEVGIFKSKSPKEAFKVEDVSKESDVLKTTPKNKRKSSGSWEVRNLDSNKEEDLKIMPPKIIKIETKVYKIVPTDKSKTQCQTYDETPISSGPVKKLSPTFWDKAKEKAFKKNKSKSNNMILNPLFVGGTPKNSKRISFALDRNEAQENEEYLKEVKNSPSIPFDGSKKPVQSALKSGLSPSPINPFYRFKKFK